MAKVSMSTELPVSSDQVWRVIGGFNALPDWHPAVETSELEEGGRVRKLHLVGGATLTERLEAFDEHEHTYTYSIEQGPLPVAGYTSTIRVRQEPGKSATVVEWSSEFKPAGAAEPDAVAAIEGVYKAGLEQLRKMFGA